MKKTVKIRIFITVCSILIASFSYSQQLISGKILDSIGESVTFASVIESNTSFGTTTNKCGEFTLNIKSLPTTVTISSPHHKQKTITLTSIRKITIILQGENTTISNVQKRENRENIPIN